MLAIPALVFLLAVLGHVHATMAVSIGAVFLLLLGLLALGFYRARD
jgi:hypothetical protein